MNQKRNEQQPLDGTPTRVLLVEYTKDITDMLELVLGAEGFIVQSVENGEKASGVAAEFKPHAALVDIGLPDINGYEVARRLRQQNPAILLIAYSGWVKEENFQLSQQAGFDHHLVKPAEIEEIISLLQTAQKTTS